MAWARVDDGWWCHPKVLTLDLEARGLWVSALSWSGQQRTDTVPYAIIVMAGGDHDVAGKLVDAGLWIDNEDGTYSFHDWTNYQSEAAQKASAGKLGGKASGEARRKKAEDKRAREAEQGASTEAEQGASAEAGPSLPVPTRPKDLNLSLLSERDVEPPSANKTWRDTYPPATKVGRNDYPAAFEAAWSAYPPNNGAKKAAYRTWRSTVLADGEDVIPQLLAAAKNYAHLVTSEGRDGSKIKHAEGFYGKDEMWRTYVDMPSNNGAPSRTSKAVYL